MTEKTSAVRGIARLILAALIYILLPFVIIWWLESNPIPDFSFKFSDFFMTGIFIFGFFFAILAFFQGFYPGSSRQNIFASFLSALLAVIFFFAFIGTAFTGDYGIIVYEYAALEITINVFWWWLIVGLLLFFTCVINFVRIFTWEPPT